MRRPPRLIVVSNRLPMTVRNAGNGLILQPSCGGLVSALARVMAENHGHWVGWTGSHYDSRIPQLFDEWQPAHGYSVGPVFLTPTEADGFYRGFSNEILWPLFHGHPSRCQFQGKYWESYRSANRKFAEAAEQASQPGDLIWVHDYHLMLQAELLRARGLQNRIGYFHHIPFPSPDIFETLPWRVELLGALSRFDQVGFQTKRDRQNFTACVRRFMPYQRKCTSLGVFPISIDYHDFARFAYEPAIFDAADAIRARLGGNQIILGVDRLDYTKGIPERLAAFEELLKHNPQLRGRIHMIQVVVPSRENIPEYNLLKLRIETLISRINGEYAAPGWVPIQYFYRSVSREELISFYRAADVAMVTPLKDGMNLVAKEFCASRSDSCGVLVLSEFAGAAEELGCGALIVNPHDSGQVARVLAQALRMEKSEQCRRMERMRDYIRANNIFTWARYCTAAIVPMDMPAPGKVRSGEKLFASSPGA